MENLIVKNKLLAATTFVSILLFELSAFFIDSGIAWMNQVKNVVYLYLLYLVAKETNGSYNPIPWNVRAFSYIVLGLVVVQLILDMATNVFTLLLKIVMLLLFVRYANLRFSKYYLNSVIIITLLSSIPLVVYYFIYGYYARDLIVFDKSYQTFLFGVSYVYLFFLLTKDNIKHKVLLLILLAYLFVCNVFILQSKTSIFAFISIVALWSFLHPSRLKKFCSRYCLYFLLAAITLPLLPFKMEMPVAIKQAINICAGQEVYKINVYVSEETYEVRRDVRKKMWKVLDESPLLGDGIGQMEQTLKSTGYSLSQGESQLVDFALEGGYTYVFAFCILIIPLLLQAAHRTWRSTSQNENEFVFLSLVLFSILCFGNETISIVTLMYIGILNYLLKLKVNIEI